MGKKLSVKHRKRNLDQRASAPAPHKVAVRRSKRALKKKAYPMH